MEFSSESSNTSELLSQILGMVYIKNFRKDISPMLKSFIDELQGMQSLDGIIQKGKSDQRKFMILITNSEEFGEEAFRQDEFLKITEFEFGNMVEEQASKQLIKLKQDLRQVKLRYNVLKKENQCIKHQNLKQANVIAMFKEMNDGLKQQVVVLSENEPYMINMSSLLQYKQKQNKPDQTNTKQLKQELFKLRNTIEILNEMNQDLKTQIRSFNDQTESFSDLQEQLQAQKHVNRELYQQFHESQTSTKLLE